MWQIAGISHSTKNSNPGILNSNFGILILGFSKIFHMDELRSRKSQIYRKTFNP